LEKAFVGILHEGIHLIDAVFDFVCRGHDDLAEQVAQGVHEGLEHGGNLSVLAVTAVAFAEHAAHRGLVEPASEKGNT
jgi:hypothetical protein